MIIDDRLNTVLRTTRAGEAGARLQFRQLVDLLGRAAGPREASLRARGLRRLRELAREISPAARAAIVGATDGLLRDPELIFELVASDPALLPLLTRRSALDAEGWESLANGLTPALRQALAQQPGLPQSVRSRLMPGEPGPATQIDVPALHRDARPDLATAASVAMPAPSAPTQIAFVSDTQAMIVAASAGQGALAGRRLTDPGLHGIDPASARNLARHLPVRGGHLTLSGAPVVSGAWIVNALPRFDPASGAFQGHYGELRRPAPAPANDAVGETADGIRQLLHELRTPLNAIQGFGELIQQQLFGPVSHAYRSLAARIIADAGAMLAACDEIDRLAVLARDGIEPVRSSTDLAQLAKTLADRLAAAAEAHGGAILAPQWPQLSIAGEPLAIERLLWRVLSAYAGSLARGGTLRLYVEPDGDLALLSGEIEGPGSATQPWLDVGPLGPAFALRLAAAEARAMRGRFEPGERGFRLSLPLAPRPYRTPREAAR